MQQINSSTSPHDTRKTTAMPMNARKDINHGYLQRAPCNVPATAEVGAHSRPGRHAKPNTSAAKRGAAAQTLIPGYILNSISDAAPLHLHLA